MSKRTLVLGASLKAERPSNLVVQQLMANGHEVFAYGFEEGDINGVKVETDMIKYKDLDTITLYLSPRRQKAYYDYIVSLKPKRVIFNPGTENPDFYKVLDAHEIAFEAACNLVLLSTDQY